MCPLIWQGEVALLRSICQVSLSYLKNLQVELTKGFSTSICYVLTFLVPLAVFRRRRLWALSKTTGRLLHLVTHSYLRYLMRSWDIFCSNVAFFQFCDVVTLAIIHKEIYPCFVTIDQVRKQKFIKILLYLDHLLEQCVETWWFLNCVLIDLGICNKTFFSKKFPK